MLLFAFLCAHTNTFARIQLPITMPVYVATRTQPDTLAATNSHASIRTYIGDRTKCHSRNVKNTRKLLNENHAVSLTALQPSLSFHIHHRLLCRSLCACYAIVSFEWYFTIFKTEIYFNKFLKLTTIRCTHTQNMNFSHIFDCERWQMTNAERDTAFDWHTSRNRMENSENKNSACVLVWRRRARSHLRSRLWPLNFFLDGYDLARVGEKWIKWDCVCMHFTRCDWLKHNDSSASDYLSLCSTVHTTQFDFGQN